MILHSLFSSRYAPQYTYLYTLHLALSTGRMAFCMTDEEQRVVALRAVQAQVAAGENLLSTLQKTLPADTTLRRNFRSVRLGIFTPEFTLVPAEYFSADHAETYLNFVCGEAEGMRTLYDFVRPLDLYCLYRVEEGLLPYAESFFPRAACYHWLSALLPGYQLESRHLGKSRVFVHLSGYMMIIFVFDEGNLRFANSFSFKTAIDFLYYVLLIYDHHKLSQERTPLHISGEITADAQIYNEVSKYIRQVELASRPAHYRMDPEMEREIPGHFYHELWHMKLVD